MRKPVSHAIQNPAYRLTGDTFGRPAASRRAPTKLQMDCAKSKFLEEWSILGYPAIFSFQIFLM
jgi:hypothetical protein